MSLQKNVSDHDSDYVLETMHDFASYTAEFESTRLFVKMKKAAVCRASEVRMRRLHSSIAESLVEILKEYPDSEERLNAESLQGLRAPERIREIIFRKDLCLEEVENDGKLARYRIHGLKEDDELPEEVDVYLGGHQFHVELEKMLVLDSLGCLESVFDSAGLQMAITTAEAFLSRTLLRYLSHFSQQFGNADIKISKLRNLDCVTYESILGLKAEETVESIMHKSPIEIDKEIMNRTKVSFRDCFGDYWDDYLEIHARRNVYVHNSGRVNEMYLNAISKEKGSGLRVGDSLPLTNEYLFRALDILNGGFATLAFRLTEKVEKDCGKMLSLVASCAYTHLIKRGRWISCEMLMRYAMELESKSDGTARYSDVNYRLARKRLGKLTAKEKAEIFENCLNLDDSDPSSVFRVTYRALIDQNIWIASNLDAFLNDVEGILDYPSLVDWPVLADFRASSEGKAFLQDRREDIRKHVTKEDYERTFSSDEDHEDASLNR